MGLIEYLLESLIESTESSEFAMVIWPVKNDIKWSIQETRLIWAANIVV